MTTTSEWVCFEHGGYARRKAEIWWRKRCKEPVPETVEQAVSICNTGGIAGTTAITVRSVSGEKYDRIIKHELGPVPEPEVYTPGGEHDDDGMQPVGWIADEDIPF